MEVESAIPIEFLTLKEEGNNFFASYNYQDALHKYQEILQQVFGQSHIFNEQDLFNGNFKNLKLLDPTKKICIDEFLSTIFSNMSECYLRLGYSLECIRCSEISLEYNPDTFKSYIRKAKGLLETKNASCALEIINKIPENLLDDETKIKLRNSTRAAIINLETRIQSSKFAIAFLQGNNDHAIQFNPGDAYLNTRVLLKRENNREWSLVAQADIPKGEIIMINRGHTWENEKATEGLVNFIDEITNKPSLRFLYSKLYPREEAFRKVESIEKCVDAFEEKFNEQIRSNSEPDGSQISKLGKSEIRKYIRKVIYNMTNLTNRRKGVFSFYSFFNHSCCPNVSMWSRIEEKKEEGVILVLSKEEIKSGEELTISYVSPFDHRIDRRISLMRDYGFSCVCFRCRLKGKWAELEPKITGFKCKHCQDLIYIKNSTDYFTCQCSQTRINFDEYKKKKAQWGNAISKFSETDFEKAIKFRDLVVDLLPDGDILIFNIENALLNILFHSPNNIQHLENISRSLMKSIEQFSLWGNQYMIRVWLKAWRQYTGLNYLDDRLTHVLNTFSAFGIRFYTLRMIIESANKKDLDQCFIAYG